MPFKDVLAAALLACALLLGILAAVGSFRLRDLMFVLMLFLAPMTELYDVNFVSRNFYRGTVRGFEISLVDVLSLSLLVAGVLRPRPGQRRIYWPAALGMMGLFFLYCCFNVAIAEPKLFALFELLKMVRGLVIFLAVAFYIRGERELKIALVALALVVSYEGFLALKQRYLWGVHRVFGTLDHSNSLSTFFCMTAPVLVAAFNSRLPVWMKGLFGVALALATVGVVLCISRAGVVILGLVLLGTALTTMSFRLDFRKVIIVSVVCVGVAGVLGKSWKTLKARFEESTLDQEYGDHENQGRGYYIRMAEAIVRERVFGVGLNNWSYWVSNLYGPRHGYHFNPYKSTDRDPSYVIKPGVTNIDDPQAAPAHSLLALTAGELGLPGLALFLLLWARWFWLSGTFLWRRVPEPMKRAGVGVFFGCWGIFLQGITEWVFRQSPIYYMFHIMIGILAALYFARKQERRTALAEQESEQYDYEGPSPAPALNY